MYTIIPIVGPVAPGWLLALYILIFTVLSQGGLLVFEKWNRKAEKPKSNEATGLIFGAISLIYSLILAFVIVAVWNDYEDLNETIEKETDKLNSILAHSSTLPDSLKSPITLSLFHYCNEVIGKEWELQDTSGMYRPSAIPPLRLMLLQVNPCNGQQESIFSVLDEDLSDISDLRRERLNHTRSHVPGVVWWILKIGSIMMIVFSYFLEVPAAKLKRIYLFFLTSIMAMSLFLVDVLDDPFKGSVEVSKKPYKNILLELQQRGPASRTNLLHR